MNNNNSTIFVAYCVRRREKTYAELKLRRLTSHAVATPQPGGEMK